MRPLEALLSLANLMTWFVFAVPPLRAVPWMRHLAPIALAIAVAQVLLEGPRWQMVPAYALAGLFFLIWLLQNIAPAGGPAGHGRTNRFASGLAVGLGVLGLAISIVLPIMLPVFRFPHPSGPYEIGTLTHHWVDADRPEVFTADSDDRRELMVQFWFYSAALWASWAMRHKREIRCGVDPSGNGSDSLDQPPAAAASVREFLRRGHELLGAPNVPTLASTRCI